MTAPLPRITGVSLADEPGIVKGLRAQYPHPQYGIFTSWDKTPEVETSEVISAHAAEVEINGDKYYFVSSMDGENLSVGPYDEWPYNSSPEAAIRACRGNRGRAFDPTAMTVVLPRYAGGEIIDSTGAVEVVEMQSEGDCDNCNPGYVGEW
jgi:hypothetical protein